MALEEFPSTNFNTRGGHAVYGPGTDGNVVITGTVVLNRDMYYNNLTVMGGAQLDSNGYRIFVKDTLNMIDATSIIGRLSDKTSAGSLLGGAPSGIKASDTLGGDGGLNPGENFFGEAEFYNFSQAIAGYKFDAVSNTLRFLMGGSGGISGSAGIDGASGSFTLGAAGTSGSAGQPGQRPGYENVIGASGGMGYPGTSASPGTDGIGGAGGLGGAGGAGGAGGGVVIISARNIIGNGIIRADGESGTPGGDGGAGSPGTNGTPGAPGSPGSPAPDFYSASYIYLSQAAYNYTETYSYSNPVVEQSETNYSPFSFISSYGYAYTILGATTYYYFYVPAYNASNQYFYPTGTTYAPYYYNVSRTTVAYNPRTLGPASVRYRTSNAYNRTTYSPVQGFYARTSYAPAYNASNQYFTPTSAARTARSYGSYSDTYAYAYTSTTTYYYTGGNTSYDYYAAYSPDQYAIEPEQYYLGGEGGTGGAGGAGGIGSAGLPGSPGTAGYAGGGGVVLVITENDVPQDIEVRAAAGTGDGGMATSGTVIIIKNEAVEGAN